MMKKTYREVVWMPMVKYGDSSPEVIGFFQRKKDALDFMKEIERYQDDYELGALSAEETLSMWIEKQTYEDPQISNRYFWKIRS